MLVNTTGLIVRCVVCFLIGSIPFAVLAMKGSGLDIRKVGSGNPGFNNVLRVNKSRAILTLIGDLGKGYFAVWLVRHPAPAMTGMSLGWLFAFCVILGHCYSPFLRFNGGKGIATSAGAMLVLYPLWAGIALAYFILSRVGASRLKLPESGMMASVTTWVLFTILMLVFVGSPAVIYAALLTVFLAFRHKKNFQNLLVRRAAEMPERRAL